MLALLLPVAIGLAPVQINIAIDRFIAEAYVPGDGANTYLFFGNRLMQLPLAMIGIAMGVAVFPGLSRLAASGGRGELARELGRAYRMTLFLALPATVGLVVLARPLIALIYEHGKFGAGATDATSDILLCYALGVFATCALQVVTRAFYALKDTRTPMLVTAGTVVLNLGLNLALVFVLGSAGLALATSITAGVNLAILTWLARRRLAVLALRPVAASAMRALAASLACGAAAWGALEGMGSLLPGDGLGARLARVLVPLAVGAAAFLGAGIGLRCPEAGELLALFRRRARG
jgi:putative peptidoglycan lipid II flippase